MIRRPPRSTLDRSSAASDVYKRQAASTADAHAVLARWLDPHLAEIAGHVGQQVGTGVADLVAVSYTHLRAHETVLDLVCRLLLEKKKKNNKVYY